MIIELGLFEYSVIKFPCYFITVRKKYKTFTLEAKAEVFKKDVERWIWSKVNCWVYETLLTYHINNIFLQYYPAKSYRIIRKRILVPVSSNLSLLQKCQFLFILKSLHKNDESTQFNGLISFIFCILFCQLIIKEEIPGLYIYSATQSYYEINISFLLLMARLYYFI